MIFFGRSKCHGWQVSFTTDEHLQTVLPWEVPGHRFQQGWFPFWLHSNGIDVEFVGHKNWRGFFFSTYNSTVKIRTRNTVVSFFSFCLFSTHSSSRYVFSDFTLLGAWWSKKKHMGGKADSELKPEVLSPKRTDGRTGWMENAEGEINTWKLNKIFVSSFCFLGLVLDTRETGQIRMKPALLWAHLEPVNASIKAPTVLYLWFNVNLRPRSYIVARHGLDLSQGCRCRRWKCPSFIHRTFLLNYPLRVWHRCYTK